MTIPVGMRSSGLVPVAMCLARNHANLQVALAAVCELSTGRHLSAAKKGQVQVLLGKLLSDAKFRLDAILMMGAGDVVYLITKTDRLTAVSRIQEVTRAVYARTARRHGFDPGEEGHAGFQGQNRRFIVRGDVRRT